jgi:hypothetical protein
MVTQIASSPPEIFGLKASNISSSIGWGAQGGTCSLTLVDEGDPASYTDLNTGATITGFPPAGTACGFNFRQFSFGGVLQKWTYKESLSGRLYDLVLESPAKLLDGSQVIISEFEAGYNVNGTKNILKYEVKNVWNAFAYFENYDYGGIFGGSQVNEGGMPVDKLFEALEYFGSNGTMHPRKFLPKTEVDESHSKWTLPIFGGKLVFGESEYTIGFSELKDMVLARAPYYRVKGPVQNISGIISDLCETVQIDYFIQLVAPVNGILEKPHLEVRIVDKAQVSAGVVEAYVNSFKGDGIVVSTNYGEELQSSPTGKLLIGGPASRVLLKGVKNSATALAVWDQIGDGTYVIGDEVNQTYGNANAKVPVSLSIQVPLPQPYGAGGGGAHGGGLTMSNDYMATIMELRMALAYPGNATRAIQNWMVYKAFQVAANAEPNNFTSSSWYGKWFVNLEVLWRAHLGQMPSHASLQFTKAYIKYADEKGNVPYYQYIQQIFAAVKRVAQKFYGQVFLVDLPEEPGGIDNNLRWIDPTFKTQYEASWDISETAWDNDKLIKDARFYDSSGKLQGYSAWNGSAFKTNIDAFGNGGVSQNIDFSAFGQDWGIDTFGFTACMKGGPNKDIFWVGGKAYCIVNSGAPVRWWDTLTTPNYGMDILSRMFFKDNNTGKPLDMVKGVQLDLSHLSIADMSDKFSVQIPPDMLPPDYVTIPQESTRYSWGPWYAVTAVANGSAEVDVDTTMTPETYGSVASMDAVGFGSVFSGLARTEAIETGSVELAQEPKFNLGDRFAAAGPYVTNLDIGIGDDGIKTSYKFSTWTPTFGKLNKYNADRIAKINKASIKFAKDMSGSKAALPRHSFPKPFKIGVFGEDTDGGGIGGIEGNGNAGNGAVDQPPGAPGGRAVP